MRRQQLQDGLDRCTTTAVNAIRRAMHDPPGEREWTQDYNQEQAVRMTRLACAFAFRLQPKLRPPNDYDIAVAAHRERQRLARSGKTGRSTGDGEP